MGRAYDKVMENRKRLAGILMENIQKGNLFGESFPGVLLNPENPVTNLSYRGVNRVSLLFAAVERGCSDPRWMTFEQIKKEGHHLRRGSKGVLCEYWDFGQQEQELEQVEYFERQDNRPRVGYYYVFNASDVEGMTPYQEREKEVAYGKEFHEFLQNKLQGESLGNSIQSTLAGVFAELEQNAYQQEICRIRITEEKIDEKILFQSIRRAQLQSEKLVEDYQTDLLKNIVESEELLVEEQSEPKVVKDEVTDKETRKSQEEQEIGKIEDFGRKIGGARKDVWRRRGLSLEDLLEMNEAERDKYVTKNNIWPKPDYEEMMQGGTPKNVVWFIKKMHDKLRSKPCRPENREAFIAFIQDLRSSAMELKTEGDCKQFWNSFFVEKGYVKHGGYSIVATEKFAGCLDNKFYKAVRVTQGDFDYLYEREMRKAQFGVPQEEKLPPGVRIVTYAGSRQGTFGVYKGTKEYANFKTREEAVQYAKENLSRQQVRKQNFVPPQLTEIRRENMEEVVTRPITGADYIDTFGFYGGEFGNWMTAADRQQSLNMGYEAFHDLAVALGIEDKDISFNGKLAMAFGARGQGSALAHYEPLRKVINLTKMRGAGSLAHEWGHALDDLLAEKLGYPKMLSQMEYQMPEYMKNVLDTMKYVPNTNKREKTQFYLEALKMDEKYCKTDKGYWTSDCEMFARAFSCYVKDKLSPGRNDYLCGHADNAAPWGEERKRINESMDRMIAALKERNLLTERTPEQPLRRVVAMRKGR